MNSVWSCGLLAKSQILGCSLASNTMSTRETGIWIGIDLGTSNCTCAIWDSTRGHPKWIRLGRFDLATPQPDNKDGRIVPSAVIFFSNDDQEQDGGLKQRERVGSKILSNNEDNVNKNDHANDFQVSIGSAALKVFDSVLHNSTEMTAIGTTTKKEEKEVLSYSAQEASAALVTSVKRISGVSKLQDLDAELRKSLPLVLEEDVEGNIVIPVTPLQSVCTRSVGASRTKDYKNAKTTTISDNKNDNHISLYPIQVTALLLRSIRLAAQDYIHRNVKRKGLRIPGYTEKMDGVSNDTIFCGCKVRNCVVGVPAHYGRNERQFTEKACRMAGFDGHVSTIIESTAAAMAYGLFVGDESTSTKKTVLIFDMGGGTTDVTIAEMQSSTLSSNRSTQAPTTSKYKDEDIYEDTYNNDSDYAIDNNNCNINGNEMKNKSVSDDLHNNIQDDNRNFRVVVTEGDGKLGGDDMDHMLMKLVVQKLQVEFTDQSFDPLSSRQHRTLLQLCKNAKERMCSESIDSGSGGGSLKTATSEQQTEESHSISFEGCNVNVNQQELNTAILPVVKRARQLVQLAVSRYAEQKTIKAAKSTVHSKKNKEVEEVDSCYKNGKMQEVVQMHEVILIGGGSKVPAIRQMLREIFPPPTPPELCTSVNSMSAVAQGAAIQAALRSNLVKKHELRSAMMLDTNPHAIGVLTGRKNIDQQKQQQQNFIEILSKDAPLPAKGYATFRLANANQPGISIQAVEKIVYGDRSNDNDVGSGDVQSYQHIGEFTFLLHRLSKEQKMSHLSDNNGERTVDVGMTLETDGKFIVSIFDPLDPEHVQKRKFFQTSATNKVGTNRNCNANSINTATPRDGGDATLDYKLMSVAVSNKEGITREEMLLLLAIGFLFIFYLVVKLTLQDYPEGTARII